MNKKGVEFTFRQVIVMVLVILVIALVVYLIYKPELFAWIREQPEYNYTVDEEVDLSGLSEEELAKKGIECDRIARMGEPEGNWLYKQIWEIREMYIYRNERIEETNLFFVVEDKNNFDLRILKGTDKLVGKIKDRILRIEPEAYSDNEVEEYLSDDDLLSLDASFLIPFFLLCKTKSQVSETRKSIGIISGESILYYTQHTFKDTSLKIRNSKIYLKRYLDELFVGERGLNKFQIGSVNNQNKIGIQDQYINGEGWNKELEEEIPKELSSIFRTIVLRELNGAEIKGSFIYKKEETKGENE